MAVTLKLVPTDAAESVAERIKLIEACEAYIRQTVARYDGLKAFETALAKHGVAEKVAKIAGGK